MSACDPKRTSTVSFAIWRCARVSLGQRATPMRCRSLPAGLVIAIVTWPLAVHAQQPAMPVVGFLGVTSAGSQPYLAALRQGLSETGYVERQNVVIEYRWAEDQ